MNLRDVPVRKKLMTIILIVSGAVSVTTCAALLSYDFMTFRRETREKLSTLGEIIATNSTAALAFQNEDDASEILTALKAEPHIVAAALYDERGRLFASYPAGRAAAAYPSGPGADGYRFAESHLIGFQSVAIGDRHLGSLYLESDMTAIYQRMRIYGGMTLLLVAASFFLAFGLSSVLQRQISRPILALTATAEAVSRGDYSIRATKQGDDELGLLTDAFNSMLGEIQKLNQELEQRVITRTAQLEAANRELESFSYTVSHDLRAPLRHIDGFAQLLDKHSGRALDETGRRYLQTIADSAKRLGLLIDALLGFSRMGRTELHHDVVAVNKLIDEVRSELQVETQGRQIEWQIGELPSIRADSALLRQVWANLLGNAVKYTRAQPLARIEVTYRRDRADGHIFSIRDNGAGFDMKYANKLFGVFQRLHSAHEFEGTGIGLASVQRIVQRHHGRVWAEGRVGEGAVFHFTVPEPNPPRS